MAYGRRRRYKRRGRRRGYKRSSGSSYRTMKKIAKQAVSSYDRKHTELKYIDTINSTSPTYNGVIIDISNISNGTDEHTRIGVKVQPHSLYFNGECVGSSQSNSYNEVRFLIFQWKQPSGLNPPTVAQILALTASNQTPHSPYVWDQRDQFRIIYDKTRIIDSTTDNSNISAVTWKKFFKLEKLHTIQFDNGFNTGSYRIYFLAVSDGAVYNPTIYYYTRLTFTDS